MIRPRWFYAIALALLAIVLVGGIAGAYSTHLAPDVPYSPCPAYLRCFIDMGGGTLVEEE